ASSLVSSVFEFVPKAVDSLARSRSYEVFLRLYFLALVAYLIVLFSVGASLDSPGIVDIAAVFDPSSPWPTKGFSLLMTILFVLLIAIPYALGCPLVLAGGFFLSVVFGGAIILIAALLGMMVLMLPIAAELGPFSLTLDISIEPAPP